MKDNINLLILLIMQQTSQSRLPFNPPGKKLGVYRFHNEIGRGNYGVVYLASDDKGNKYAIKSIKKEIFKENGGIIGDLIRNEKNALLQIKNNHVVRIYEYIESVNQAYMILELCDGGNFEGYLACKKFQITVYEAVQYIKQIIQGVNALHEKRIIHRDLKLSNILMKDNSALLKIADLGFCHILSDYESLAKLNLGTIGTKAPEIILNKPYDCAVDIFSTGVMFYQLLCGGNYPFHPTTEEEYLDQILKGRKSFKVSQRIIQPFNHKMKLRRKNFSNQLEECFIIILNKDQNGAKCSIVPFSKQVHHYNIQKALQLETHLGFNSRVQDVKKIQDFYIQNQEKIVSMVSPKFADIGHFTFPDEVVNRSLTEKEQNQQIVANDIQYVSTVSFQDKDEIQQIQQDSCKINELFEKYLTLHQIVYDLIHKTNHLNVKQILFPILIISKRIFKLQKELIKIIDKDGNIFDSPYYNSLIITDQWKVLIEEMLNSKNWIYEQVQHNIKTFYLNINQRPDDYKKKYVQSEWLEEADVYFSKENFDNIFQQCINRYIGYLIQDIYQVEKDQIKKKIIIVYLVKILTVNEIEVDDIPIYQLEPLLQSKNVDKLFQESYSIYMQKQ
ncbi:unnamed protein product (macronuclear) [Paramecium tetraurelia]|uniref:Protein kinase domain-containing protein n=1 Tax=Paramecium tetraurelia TaxID=5888 RepID=A0CAI1_PARTE|nr:uncharacterized protein GSPATT00036578001 [Paramecium tetraurelia]CAK67798.1 unnamed protein product [Paramecium tetraurelia]|eukprot:XP_001435195.1 hypothetical protein (macronuclear) [Paramecium tetraurelia strain d4-2]